MTLKQLDALMEQYRAGQEREDFRAAKICLVVARAAGAEDVSIDDFMPPKQVVHRPQSWQEQMAVFQNLKIKEGG